MTISTSSKNDPTALSSLKQGDNTTRSGKMIRKSNRRRIYGVVKINETEWRIRNSEEINNILVNVHFLKLADWAGSATSNEWRQQERQKVTLAKIYYGKTCESWEREDENRIPWRRIVEEAKAHIGLQCNRVR